MIKKYIPFHQFKKIGESIIDDMLESSDLSVAWNTPYQEMLEEAEDGYYHNDSCEISFWIPKYNNELITVIFEISLSFDERYDPGDYYQPPEYDVLNENLDIYVQDIIMGDYDFEINLSSNEVKKLETFIEKMLTD
jgi:hypothetical protein